MGMVADEWSDLEKALGARLDRKCDRKLPGSVASPDEAVIYYQDDGRATPRKLFDSLLDGVQVRSAKAAGRYSDPCSILTPNGVLFRAMFYHGDLSGWRGDVIASTEKLGILTAEVEAGELKVSDGSTFTLDSCEISLE